jgi:preprotein translocase subunit SecD
MRKVLLAAAVTVLFSSAYASASPKPGCPRIELTAVLGPAHAGDRQVQSEDGSELRLAPSNLVDPADVTDANVTITEGRPVLNLTFKSEAAARVRTFTSANLGKLVAVLVDGKSYRTLKVLDPIIGDGILIGPVSKPDAEALAARINACQSH